jgi:hypothetical protein
MRLVVCALYVENVKNPQSYKEAPTGNLPDFLTHIQFFGCLWSTLKIFFNCMKHSQYIWNVNWWKYCPLVYLFLPPLTLIQTITDAVLFGTSEGGDRKSGFFLDFRVSKTTGQFSTTVSLYHSLFFPLIEASCWLLVVTVALTIK